MKKAISFLSFQSSHQTMIYGLFMVISIAYLVNFHVNDIWTPNESFYAEAVREMFESGNFLDINYNYEARYNKPPLTYWMMAISSGILGLSEFSLRLPIVLLGLGSILLTYLLGKKLFGEKEGLYAMLLVAFTIQYLAVKQYASPEMPLTFFFTLTIYWFYVGFKENRSSYLILSYLALGLTTLTKGFPYIIVIGGIIGLYLLLSGEFKWIRIWSDVKRLKLHIGIPLTLIIGLSWVIFMYLKDGQTFWDIYYTETFGRALSKESKGLKPFFYLEVLSWSVIPCTLAFIYALVYHARHKALRKEVILPASWLAVMLVIFTTAKGKLPTYMIQAHPAVILIIVPLLTKAHLIGISRIIWNASFYIIAFGLLAGNFLAIDFFGLSIGYYILPLASLSVLIILFWQKNHLESNRIVGSVFWTGFFLAFTFALFLPSLEKIRPYDEIGEAINQNSDVNQDTPLYIEGTLIHNLPFYAKRRVERDATIEEINSHSNKTLALIRKENSNGILGEYDVLWEDYIYDFPSESQFFKFVRASKQASNGDFSKFAKYQLILKR